MLRTFSRIIRGDSFRIPSFMESMSTALPPNRILDLHVEVHTGSQQLEFSWTAPGADFDQGKATSYQLFSSDEPSVFYTNLNSTKPLDGFSAIRPAGEKETHRVTVTDLNKNIFYALVAIDQQGNVGEVSNVKQAYMPSPSSTSSFSVSEDGHPHSFPEHRLIAGKRSEEVILYIIVGIVGFIVLCIILILIIFISYRRKKMSSTASDNDLSETMRSMGVSTGHNNGMGPGGDDSTMDTHSPGYAVCDEQDLVKDTTETNRFITGGSYSNSDGSGVQNSVSFADENPYANNSTTYGWTQYNNPYVTQYSSSTLPTYRDFQIDGNGYVPNTFYNQPMYAKPVPKSQRVYANATVAGGTPTNPQGQASAALQHSTPQSPSGSSSQSSYTHNIASSLVYRQNLANSLLAQANTSNGLNEADRVPSISPPISDSNGAQSENIRLISSLSNTPTKSILKKPKHEVHRTQARDVSGDHTSQSSSGSGSGSGGKELERLSESSNVSFSDRDTPTEANNPSVNDKPDFSPSNTYLETSFEVESTNNKVPPPTLPKPKLDSSQNPDLDSTMDRKIRNITQV